MVFPEQDRPVNQMVKPDFILVSLEAKRLRLLRLGHLREEGIRPLADLLRGPILRVGRHPPFMAEQIDLFYEPGSKTSFRLLLEAPGLTPPPMT